jgi:hypothetical protein
LAAVRENVSIVRAEESFSGYAGFAAKSAGVSIMNCLIFWYHTKRVSVYPPASTGRISIVDEGICEIQHLNLRRTWRRKKRKQYRQNLNLIII